jgi:rhodanese-related sulfurtransferase
VTSRRLAALALSALLLIFGGACGTDAESPSTGSSAASTSASAPVSPSEALDRIADGADVIDVRTAEEFDAGHLDGAVNLDVQEPDFEARVSELSRDESYVVYCASGRRATGAVEKMVELGFTDVVNGGGYADLTED